MKLSYTLVSLTLAGLLAGCAAQNRKALDPLKPVRDTFGVRHFKRDSWANEPDGTFNYTAKAKGWPVKVHVIDVNRNGRRDAPDKVSMVFYGPPLARRGDVDVGIMVTHNDETNKFDVFQTSFTARQDMRVSDRDSLQSTSNFNQALQWARHKGDQLRRIKRQP